jgi:MFS family permease
VSAVTAPIPSAEPSSRPAAVARRPGLWLVTGALAVAALSLLLPWALAFDPAMWLVWGRDVTRLTLDTRAGPSWKPGPVLLTAPFSLLGGAAPALWLVVARAGALLALAGAWTLGRRLAGPWAGAAAAAAMALSPWWLPNAALGNSEGILAAAVLWAVAAHLAGRRRAAVLLGLVAALLRPEVWPFLGLYGLWAWRADPRTRPALVLAAIAVPVLWFGPDVTGAGGALGASDAARGTPSEGSAKLAEHPVLAVLWDAVKLGGIPVFVLAVVAGLLRRDRLVLALWAGVAGWVAVVAVMTAAGYAGNPRYLVAAAAVLAVLAGAGAVWLTEEVRLPAAAALVLPLAVGALAFAGLRDDLRDVGVRADRREALPRVIDAAGGRDALVRCARIRTAGVVRGLVAWQLDVSPYRINAAPEPPATVLQMRPYAGGAPDPAFAMAGYRRAAAEPGWTVWEACGG